MVTYRFLGGSDQLESKLAGSLRNLNGLGEEQLGQFASIVLEALSERNVLSSKLSEFADSQGLNVKKLKALTNLAESLLTVLGGALQHNVSSSALQEDLMLIGLTEEASAVIGNCWQGHYVSLNTKAALKTLTTNRLVDMEWNFGVTVASDSAASSSNTFLHIQMIIDEAGKQKRVEMELTLKQFYCFLREMEKIQARMNAL